MDNRARYPRRDKLRDISSMTGVASGAEDRAIEVRRARHADRRELARYRGPDPTDIWLDDPIGCTPLDRQRRTLGGWWYDTPALHSPRLRRWAVATTATLDRDDRLSWLASQFTGETRHLVIENVWWADALRPASEPRRWYHAPSGRWRSSTVLRLEGVARRAIAAGDHAALNAVVKAFGCWRPEALLAGSHDIEAWAARNRRDIPLVEALEARFGADTHADAGAV